METTHERMSAVVTATALRSSDTRVVNNERDYNHKRQYELVREQLKLYQRECAQTKIFRQSADCVLLSKV